MALSQGTSLADVDRMTPGDFSHRVVLSLGENTLVRPHEVASLAAFRSVAFEVLGRMRPVLMSKTEVVVTHGNGPQVGNMLAHSESARAMSYPLTLDRGVAAAQGEIGDILASALRTIVEGSRSVAVLLTHVRVDADSAGRGFRRGVASAEPLEILDVDVIRQLVESKVIAIAGGGGGIPVVVEGDRPRHVEAIIEKDLTSALLADAIDADRLVIVTDVPCAYMNFGTARPTRIDTIQVDKLQALLAEGHFAPGSMAPKVESCVRFVRDRNRRAIVVDPQGLPLALKGEAGTQVVF